MAPSALSLLATLTARTRKGASDNNSARSRMQPYGIGNEGWNRAALQQRRACGVRSGVRAARPGPQSQQRQLPHLVQQPGDVGRLVRLAATPRQSGRRLRAHQRATPQFADGTVAGPANSLGELPCSMPERQRIDDFMADLGNAGFHGERPGLRRGPGAHRQ